MNKDPLFFPLNPLNQRLLLLIHHKRNKELTELKACLGYFALFLQCEALVNRQTMLSTLISWLEASNLN